MEIVSINGKNYDISDAKISVFDRGYLYGDQCCEAIRAYNGKPFLLDRHLMRLQNSLMILKIPEIDLAEVEEQINNLLLASELTSASVRISVSRGTCSEGFRLNRKLTPNVVIVIKEYHELPYELFSQGVAVVVGQIKRMGPESWPLNAKNINLNNVLANLEAQEAGAFEAIMLNSEGYLTEGTVSNLFWIKEDRLYTPADYLGILPGITREVVLELAEKIGLSVLQGEYFPDELAEADEAFLTNSLMEILPIKNLDGKQLSSGSAGRFTTLLRETYHQQVSAGTS